MEASSPLNESRYAYYKVNLDFLTKFVHLRASLSDMQEVPVYDKVNLDFLFELLELRDFISKIISLITTITQGGSVVVNLDDVDGDFFMTLKL
jgi:hypothetical protein